jgi:hypothetical protein
MVGGQAEPVISHADYIEYAWDLAVDGVFERLGGRQR